MAERFSTSLEPELLKQFDRFIDKNGYENRSEAVRDLIRRALIAEEWEAGAEVVGVVTLVFDHHQRQLQDQVTEAQHEFHHEVVSTTHVHLDHHNCLEVVIVRGKAGRVREMAQRLIALRGVKDGHLTTTSTGRNLA
ncbi:MAG TPA: nickel-responsive transcriptional regulator NikR [Verrucomicrobia bacterium]|nr:MAG: nickel-responsive regulator [Lentisphaerae bacterium GWF2_57_35]HBA82783.1 nickel-responsive transcriptional regulator NikR [Verrucomicrobiota bacterium]